MFDNALNLISLSLAFSLIGLNVFLTKRILNITDLTCDASFALGGCAYGMALMCEMNPLLAFLFAMSLGTLAGLVTSSFVNHVGMTPIIASIVSLVAVQSVVLKFTSIGRIMMRNDIHSSLGSLSALDNFVITVFLVSTLCLIFYRLITSEYGLAMRVCGSGQIIAESLGIQSSSMLFVGLAIGNLLSAIGGMLVTQISGTFSATMGIGTLIFGLSAIIIGERIVCPKSIKESFLACFIGAFIYKAILGIFTGCCGNLIFGYEYNQLIIAVVFVCLMVISKEHKFGRHV